MENPTPKRRSRKKPDTVDPQRTVSEAPEIKDEKVTLTIETPEPNPPSENPKTLTPKMTAGEEPHYVGNRYAPKLKVGTPTLGRSPNYVTTVGLGNLKVTTVNGRTNSNVQSDSSGSA